MKAWFLRSFKKGIVTSSFPSGKNESLSPWATTPAADIGGEVNCPVDAIHNDKVDSGKCISCGICFPQFKPSLQIPQITTTRVEKSLSKSMKLYIFDSGTCGACNLEIMALNSPQYDMNRLGLSFTNTPRQADAIMVTGVLTDGMIDPLKAAIDSMASPKIVFAVGACAISGGIMGKSISEIVGLDVQVPGCPPDPFVIMAAIEKARGRI